MRPPDPLKLVQRLRCGAVFSGERHLLCSREPLPGGRDHMQTHMVHESAGACIRRTSVADSGFAGGGADAVFAAGVNRQWLSCIAVHLHSFRPASTPHLVPFLPARSWRISAWVGTPFSAASQRMVAANVGSGVYVSSFGIRKACAVATPRRCSRFPLQWLWFAGCRA